MTALMTTISSQLVSHASLSIRVTAAQVLSYAVHCGHWLWSGLQTMGPYMPW